MDEEERKFEYEYRKERYEAYLKERDALRSDSLAVSDRYDKAILALAGGSLALSVTFLEKIAPHPFPWTFSILALSWAFLIGSILFELFALSSSQTATNEEMERLSQEYGDYLLSLQDAPKSIDLKLRRTKPDPELYARRTRRWNTISLWLLTAGIGMLCLFSVFNLPWRAGKHEHEIKTTK